MDKKLIIKDIQDILAIFEKLNVPIYLSYGALLGAVRDGKLIPWDDDIDFDVTAKLDLKTRKEIGWLLTDLGFKTQPIVFNVFGRMEPAVNGYNGDATSGIIVCERNFQFSIFFYKDDGDDYNCYPMLGAQRLIGIPKRFFDGDYKVKLYREKFRTPGPHKDYLTYVYGKDWKKPIKDLHAPNCITGKQKHE